MRNQPPKTTADDRLADAERDRLSLHLRSVEAASAPDLPTEEPNSTQDLRERLASEGIRALEQTLAPYGEPPLLPIKRGGARDTTERRIQQADLTRSWLSLRARRREAHRGNADWARAERARLAGERGRRQTALDDSWKSLLDHEPSAVTSAVERALDGSPVRVAGADGQGGVTLVLACPEPADIVAEHEPVVTVTGRVDRRLRRVERRHSLYVGMLASSVLHVTMSTFAASPATDSIRIVAARHTEKSLPCPIYAAEFARLDHDLRSAVPEELVKAIDTMPQERLFALEPYTGRVTAVALSETMPDLQDALNAETPFPA